MTNGSEPSTQLSPLKRAFLALEQMQTKLDAAERARTEPVAIVGMGCRLPGADNLDAFWQLLRDGVETVSEVPADRWDINAYYDPDPDAPGKMSTRRGGFLSQVDRFDPQFFSIAPREAVSMDPQQRLLLEVAWEALEHAGIAPDGLKGSRTGVFVGVTSGDYAQLQLQAAGLAGLDAYYASGVAHSIASGRLSYVFGFQGPSITLDTACSSSLVSIHLAVQSLRTGDCRMALAGGVNLILSPENSVTLSKYHMMAPDGRCKAFDAAADGFVRGEGCGLVVLKRLADALADGDRVLAIIRGSAVNQDGPSSSLTAPNGPSQEAVIREALLNANIAPHEVSYVETHGTGTALGDPIEVQALAAALSAGRAPDAPLMLGSVKTNIGHVEAAAGVVGVIKTVLMLQQREIPPHLHLHEPNPMIDWQAMPIVIPTTRTPWQPINGRRIAGVSSFGFSGTNAHIVLEEPAAAPASAAADPRPLHILTLSAKSEPALRALADRFAAQLAAQPALALADVCHTANAGRAHFGHRLALTASSTEQLQSRLAAFAAGQQEAGTVTGQVASADPPKIAFLFTGQGAQYPGMARQLYVTQPVFRAALDRCAAILQPLLDRPLLDMLFESDPALDMAHPLHQTANTQPALFAIEYALAALWQAWGITPQALLGHSVGEYVAACVAGVFSLEDGLKLIVARGRLMQALPAGGAMTAIFAPEQRVRTAVAPHAAQVSIAAINGPEHTVISGVADAVQRIADAFAAEGVRVERLRVSHAFHSPLMTPMLAEFRRVAASVTFATPKLRLISNLTGLPVGREITEPDYWVRHIRDAVQFSAGIATLQQSGHTVFIELGPHPVLLGMARASVPSETGTWLPSLRRNRDDWQQLLESLAGLYVAGGRIDWASVDAPYTPRKLDLPTYPFQRQRYWIQPRRHTIAHTSQGEHPLLGQRLRSPLKTITFESQVGTETLAYLNDHRVFETAILPATAYLEAALVAATALGAGMPALENVVIHEALIVAEGELRTLQSILTPEAGGALFQLFSQGADEPEWKLHASGSALIGQPIAPPPTPLDPIRARCAEEVTAEAHYQLLAAHGLDFGPSLRGVRKIWKGQREAFGEIALPDAQASAARAYHVHPALLDACIQIIAELSASSADTYLPIGIEHVALYERPGTQVWAHATLRGNPAAHAETLTGDVRMLAADGRVLVEVTGISLKRAGRAALLRLSQREQPNDWLYQVEWRPLPTSGDAELLRSADFIPATSAIAARSSAQIERLHDEHDLKSYQHMLDQLELLSSDYIILALEQLGVQFSPGAHFSAADLAVVDHQRALLNRLLEIMAEDGLLRHNADQWEVLARRATGDVTARWTQLSERYPAGRGELMLARRCGEGLAEVLNGSADPLQLLFPGGSLEYAEQMYQQSPFSRFYNSLLGEALAGIVAQLPAGRPLRVLEIGAGTGGTSSYALPQLPADRTAYTYTDISQHFLTKAREKFGAYPFIEYRTLDIERDLAEQGFGEGQYDLIIAANVLHATADLRHTFAQVARLLVHDGALLMLEMIRSQRFIDISFGMTEGWWKFTDTDVRLEYLLLDRERWLRFLADQGFATPIALPASEVSGFGAQAVQAVIMARAQHSVAAAPTMPAGLRSWLVLADANVGEQFAELVTQRGGRVVIARPGAEFRQVAADRFELDATQPADFARLLRDASGATAFDGVAYLWGIDGAHAAAHAQELRLGSALLLTQALINSNAAARLFLVTRGAQPESGVAPDAAQAPLWGFGKVVALEHPELRATRIDLDPTTIVDAGHDLLRAVLANSAEDAVIVRGGERRGARLTRVKPLAKTNQPVELAISARGTLDNLVLQPATRRVPGPGEVEIRVYATGLNFKDVLNTLGMYPGNPGALGGECAGVVVALGAGVDNLHVGDAVVALAPGCFRSYVTTAAGLVVLKPLRLTFAEAAALPIANITADFALSYVGQMRAGERVLIHAAAGGVGLAAVRLAQRVGAEVYATAGNTAKRDFLASIGVRHIYDSRSLAFAEQIRADTASEGVDLVLNSLAGDFVGHSLALLRDNGRFLEIGKRDHLSAEQASALGRDIAYHVIDWTPLVQQEPQLIQAIMLDCFAAVNAGRLPPMPMRIFPLDQAQAAFRYMAQAKHIGKVVVVQPEAADDLPAPELRPDASYLITGGLSGLGLLTARRLVERGARHIALLGRRAATDATRAVIAELESAGAQVLTISGDVSHRADVERALALIDETLPPLRGVFHSAGVLDDGALTQQTWQRFHSVLAPKVDGAWHLHQLTEHLPLDYFVLYSSIASLLGSRGQANHAAANAFLDTLAQHRRARGLPALSINWGAWEQVGAAAERGVNVRATQGGIGSLTPEQGLAMLEQLMQRAAAQVGVTPMQWATYLTRFPNGTPPFFSEVADKTAPKAIVTPVATQPDVRRQIDEAAPHRRRDILLAYVQAQSARVLALPLAQVNERTPLNELGLDSLMAVELRNLLGAELGLARPLPATLVFDYPTITAISNYLADQVLALAAEPSAGEPEPTPAIPANGALVSSMLDDLEDMSDEEIERMFAQKMST